MKWLVGIALVLASASIVGPALLRYAESTLSSGRLDRIHESASL